MKVAPEFDRSNAILQDIYGTVNYTPGETVKRPTDSEANGGALRRVYDRLRAESNLPPASQQPSSAWSTGIR